MNLFRQQVVTISMLIATVMIFTACGGNNNEQAETDTTHEPSILYEQNLSIAEADTDISADETNEELSSHDYGKQVATEFLSGFTTLFLDFDTVFNFHNAMLGFDITEPSFNPWEAIVSNLHRLVQDPDIVPQEFIDDRSFSIVGAAADSFILFDVHDNGIPLIGISNISLFANGEVPFIMYNYINGSYLEVGKMWLPWPRDLYRDQEGNIIALEGSHFAGELYSVNTLIIQDSIFRSTIKQAPSWEAWWDLDENYLAPDMPLSDFRSIRMVELEEQIREYLTPIAEEFSAHVIANPPTPPAGAVAIRAEDELRTLASEALPLHLWPADGFILYFSSERLIYEYDYDFHYSTNEMRRIIVDDTWLWRLQNSTPQERRIARNEIFARHGRRFSDPALQAYFDLQTWYTPTLPLGVEPVLNPIERENAGILQRLN